MMNDNNLPAIDFRAIFDRAFKKASAANLTATPKPDAMAKVNQLLNAMAQEKIDQGR